MYHICLLPGDGIGPEVIASAGQVLRALPLDWDFSYADIGFGAYQEHGTPLPDSTLETIRASDATLFGSVTTPPDIPDYFSPVVRMRQPLGSLNTYSCDPAKIVFKLWRQSRPDPCGKIHEKPLCPVLLFNRRIPLF